jgi:hypothetical protein
MISDPNGGAAEPDPIAFIATPTPQLRALLAQQRSLLPAAEFADMLSSVRSIFAKFSEKLRCFTPGAERAIAFHRLMDHELEAAASIPVSCHRGCSGCCHYEVEITSDEAVILAEIVRHGFPVDRARLDRQAARERKSPEWLRFWSPENRCVFLGTDGACQIYDHRPSICRKHLVTTPASSCTDATKQVAPVQVLLAEILMSAALSIEGTTSASMSKMLLGALAS